MGAGDKKTHASAPSVAVTAMVRAGCKSRRSLYKPDFEC